MMLSPQRLQEWTGNPEKYHHAEEERSAEEDADAAAQNLFLDLAESKDGRANVAPLLLQILNDLRVRQMLFIWRPMREEFSNG